MRLKKKKKDENNHSWWQSINYNFVWVKLKACLTCELGVFSPRKSKCVCVHSPVNSRTSSSTALLWICVLWSPVRCQCHPRGWVAMTRLFHANPIFPSLVRNRPSFYFHETQTVLGPYVAQLCSGAEKGQRRFSPPDGIRTSGQSSRVLGGCGPRSLLFLLLSEFGPCAGSAGWDSGCKRSLS